MKSTLRRSHAFPPLLVILCLSVTIFLVLSLRFGGFAVAEFTRFNRGMADGSAENADQVVERLKGFALNVLEDSDLLAWLASPDPDALADYKAEWRLMRSFAAEPFVTGALLLAPDRGYLLDTSSRRWDWESYPDQDMLTSVSRPGSYLRMVAGGYGPSEWLALPLPLDYAPEGVAARTRRSVVLVLNRPLVEKYVLRSGVGGAPFRAFVLDSTGKVVLGAIPEVADARGGPDEGALWGALVGRGVVDTRFRVGSQAWLFSARPLEREDWTLVSGVRLEELGERALHFEILLIAALVILVLMYWGALKWSEVRLLRPYRGMEAEHRELARQEALHGLFASGALDPREEALLRTDFGFDVRAGFSLCAARIEAYSSWRTSVSPKAQRSAIFSVVKVWEDLGRSGGVSCLGVDLTGDTLFLAAQERGASPSTSRVDELLGNLPGKLTIARPGEASPSLAFASCEIVPGRDDVRFAVESLRELTYLKFISGEGKVYREADMAKTLDRQPVREVQDEADNLVQAVRATDPEELGVALLSMKERMRELPYSECRLRLVMISFILFKEFSLQLADDGGFQGLERSFGAFGSLGEAVSWIGDRLSAVQTRLSAPPRGGRKSELVEEAEAFVLNELSDFTLNLDRVAAQVGLSSGYLRQVYKELRGQTLSDFIHDRRIQRIKEQLERTDLPISRLIERSGFQTKSHFFTSFKAVTGLTPDQYRRLKRNPV